MTDKERIDQLEKVVEQMMVALVSLCIGQHANRGSWASTRSTASAKKAVYMLGKSINWAEKKADHDNGAGR